MADPELHFEESGAGETVVFLHGFLESTEMWKSLGFAPRCRCILIDLPGHGKSPVVEDASMPEMAAAVMSVLKKLNAGDYTVIGHSMGGYVALELLRTDPQCHRVVMLNSNPWPDDEAKRRDRERVANLVLHHKKQFIYEAIPHLFKQPEAHETEVRTLIQEACHMKPEGIAAAALGMGKRSDHTDTARAAGKHVLILQGLDDTVAPVDRMRDTGLPQTAEYHELTDCAHMAHIEQAEVTREIINRFLG